MSDQPRGLRRYLQFRMATLLALMTGVGIGFGPLKLWELWQSGNPYVVMQLQIVEVEQDALPALFGNPRPHDGHGGSLRPVDEAFLDRLAAAMQARRASLVTSPSLMTLNGQPAHMQSGSEIPVVRQRSGATTSLEYVTVGVSVGITPTVLRNRRICMEYDIKLRDLRKPAPSGDDRSWPPIDEQTISGEIEAAAGQTLLLGSLGTAEQGTRDAKQPPCETLVFVTLQNVNPGAPALPRLNLARRADSIASQPRD